MITELERQTIIDEEHLRLLPVLYWVLGGLDIFISLYGLIYVAMGAVVAMVPWQSSSASDAPPAFLGWFFFAIGAGFMLAFGGSAALKIATGFWIRKRRHRTATLIMAGVSCLSVPFGTLVGVLSFMVLLRPSVASLYSTAVRPATVGDQAPTPGDDSAAGLS